MGKSNDASMDAFKKHWDDKLNKILGVNNVMSPQIFGYVHAMRNALIIKKDAEWQVKVEKEKAVAYAQGREDEYRDADPAQFDQGCRIIDCRDDEIDQEQIDRDNAR